MCIKSTVIALSYLLCHYKVYAVLSPGYEDVMYCPEGYCDRFVSHDNGGFVGPASSFHECYNPETGDVMDEVWTGSSSNVVAPEGWVENPPPCECQQGQPTCEDNPEFKVGRRTCASILQVPKSCKSSKSMRHKLLCTDEEVALNCPRSCGLCLSQEGDTTVSTAPTTNDDDDDGASTSSISENSSCTCFNSYQLTKAVEAIQQNQTNFNQVSCTPGSNYKSIVYQLHGEDIRFPYRHGVEGSSEALPAQCFQFDMHSLIDETTYKACKELMDSACALLSN